MPMHRRHLLSLTSWIGRPSYGLMIYVLRRGERYGVLLSRLATLNGRVRRAGVAIDHDDVALDDLMRGLLLLLLLILHLHLLLLMLLLLLLLMHHLLLLLVLPSLSGTLELQLRMPRMCNSDTGLRIGVGSVGHDVGTV